jgi:hypothetical protein
MGTIHSKPRIGPKVAKVAVNRQEDGRDLGRQTMPDVRLLKAITDLFAKASSMQTEETCHCCQSPMDCREVHFWIYGTDIKWQIPVATCPVCDADSLERLLKRPRIQ